MTDRPSRRTLLKTLGAGLAVGSGVSVLLPDQSRSALARAETEDVESAELSDTGADLDRTDTSYGLWQYKVPRGGGMEATAPMNVLFPLENATVSDVVAVFEDAGWYPNPFEYIRYGYDRSSGQYDQQAWTGAETRVGVSGRLHVRTFELDGTLSAQAHVDSAATPKHEVPSYADGERAVVALFFDRGWERSAYWLDNRVDPDHNGVASVLYR